MASNSFRIKSKIDVETFTAFSYFHNFILGNTKIGFIFGTLSLILLAFVNLFTGSLPLFIIFILIAVAVPIIYYLFYKRTLLNQIKANDLTTPKDAYTLLINEEGVTAINQTEKALYPWNKIFRVYRTQKYIYIYIIKNKAFILPFKDLESTSPDVLWNYISSHTQKNKYFPKV